MREKSLVLLVMFIFSLIASSTAVVAATRNVPTTKFPTIQAAIDAANPGDIVKVAPGTYYENIILKAKVAVQGAGAENTIIDGSYIGSVVTAENVSEAKIDGFTITGGYSFSGGGIYCYQSSLIISNNIITGNDAVFYGYGDGGGIYCYQSSPTITHNKIIMNSAEVNGGGIQCDNSSPTITHNTIMLNDSQYRGGGIYCENSFGIISNNTITLNGSETGGGISFDSSSLTISNNTITYNFSTAAGGILCEGGTTDITNNIITENYSVWAAGIRSVEGTITITNNTITGNWGDPGEVVGGVSCEGGTTTITNSIIWGNGSDYLDDNYDLIGCTASYSDVGKSIPVLGEGLNNISTDPMFVDATNGDYHLLPSSLLIDAGSNEAPSLPEHDFEGNPRIYNLLVDIGADEVAPQVEILIKDGSQNPPVNTKSNGVIPVAILGNAFFNILDVDVTSIPPTFGPDASVPRHDLSHPGVYAGHQKDVNGDGYTDLVLHFNMQDTGIQPEDTEACLTFSVGINASYAVCHGINAR